jgi:hypothetical protein
MPSEPSQNAGWGYAVTVGVAGIGLASAATYNMYERGGKSGLEFGLVWFIGLALLLAWFWLSGRKTRRGS